VWGRGFKKAYIELFGNDFGTRKKNLVYLNLNSLWAILGVANTAKNALQLLQNEKSYWLQLSSN
jgi:hypothetical protein